MDQKGEENLNGILKLESSYGKGYKEKFRNEEKYNQRRLVFAEQLTDIREFERDPEEDQYSDDDSDESYDSDDDKIFIEEDEKKEEEIENCDEIKELEREDQKLIDGDISEDKTMMIDEDENTDTSEEGNRQLLTEASFSKMEQDDNIEVEERDVNKITNSSPPPSFTSDEESHEATRAGR